MALRKVLIVFSLVALYAFSSISLIKSAAETRVANQNAFNIKQGDGFLFEPKQAPWDLKPNVEDSSPDSGVKPEEGLSPGGGPFSGISPFDDSGPFSGSGPGDDTTPNIGKNPWFDDNSSKYSDRALEDSSQFSETLSRFISYIGILFSMFFSIFALSGLSSSEISRSASIIISNIFLNLFFIISVLFILLKKDTVNKPQQVSTSSLIKVIGTETFNKTYIRESSENNVIPGQLSFDNLIDDQNNNTER